MATGVNAKNIAFDQPGSGLAGYEITPANLNAKLIKLYQARTQKEGGSKSIWDAMVNNTTKSLARSPDSVTAQQFQQFLNTGKMPAKPTAGFQKYAAESIDYGLRETGRAQQHKPVSLLSQIAGPLLTIAASAIPVVGPYAGAAVGGYMGSRNGGGPLGAILGATGGYLGGSSIANAGGIGNYVSNIGKGISGFVQHPLDTIGNALGGSSGGFSNPSALGITGLPGANFSSMPGAFPSTLGATGYGSSALGLTGSTVTSALGGLGPLAGPSSAQIGNAAVGGNPDSLYTPKSGFAPTANGTIDKVVKAVNSGAKIAGMLGDPPNAGAQIMAPSAVGSPSMQMVPHGAVMRPFIPMRYPSVNSNPFMARIV